MTDDFIDMIMRCEEIIPEQKNKLVETIQDLKQGSGTAETEIEFETEEEMLLAWNDSVPKAKASTDKDFEEFDKVVDKSNLVTLEYQKGLDSRISDLMKILKKWASISGWKAVNSARVVCKDSLSCSTVALKSSINLVTRI